MASRVEFAELWRDSLKKLHAAVVKMNERRVERLDDLEQHRNHDMVVTDLTEAATRFLGEACARFDRFKEVAGLRLEREGAEQGQW